MTCGGQMPTDVRDDGENDYRCYVCPECGDLLLEGIVSTNGEPANSPKDPPSRRGVTTLRADLQWDTWEFWWTNRYMIEVLHGVPVSGTAELLDFVEDFQQRHGNTT